MNKVYSIITDRIIEKLEKGTIPWRQPWSAPGVAPTNLHSKRPYHGCNVLLLSMMPFSSPYWVTYKQAKKLDGHVEKGQKSTPVIFWKILVKDRDTGEKLNQREAQKERRRLGRQEFRNKYKTIPILRYFNVFNVEQTTISDEQIPDLDQFKNDWEPIDQADNIINSWTDKPGIFHDSTRAYYRKSKDEIHLPEQEFFKSGHDYYSTLFHEAVHSTGHDSRLNRDLEAGQFNKSSYGYEELVAEIGASFLNHEAGILEPELENTTAYIESWLNALKDDNHQHWIVTASAQAQKAVDYIMEQ